MQDAEPARARGAGALPLGKEKGEGRGATVHGGSQQDPMSGERMGAKRRKIRSESQRELPSRRNIVADFDAEDIAAQECGCPLSALLTLAPLSACSVLRR